MGRATAGSLIASAVGQAGTAVSGVLVARMLGVENRGYLALLILWPTILARVAGLGLPLALPFFISQAPDKARSFVRAVIRPLVLQSGFAIAAQVVVLLLLLPGKPRAVQIAGMLTLLIGPISLCAEYALSVLQGQQRFGAFNVIRAGPATLYCVLAVVLFVTRNESITPVVIALLVASTISTWAAFLGVRRGLQVNSKSTLRPYPLKPLLQFGVKGLLGSVSPIETFRLDQAIVGLFLTPASLGLYVVAIAFTNLPRFIAQSVGFVAYPYVAANRTKQWSVALPFLVFTLGSSSLVVVLLIVSAGAVVPTFFGPQFAGAVTLTRVLLVGALFFAARRVLTDASRGLGAASAGSIAEVLSWTWLAAAVVLLLPRMGVMGVAISLTTSAAFSLLVLVFALFIIRPPGQRVEEEGVTPDAFTT